MSLELAPVRYYFTRTAPVISWPLQRRGVRMEFSRLKLAQPF